MEPAQAADETSSGSSRPLLGRWVPVIALVVALAFGGLFVSSRWHDFVDALEGTSAGWVAVAAAAAVASFVTGMLSFRSLLQAASPSPVTVEDGARIFYLSQLGKYVPGWVWPAVATVTMSRRLGVTSRDGASVWAVSLAVSMCAGGAVGMSASVGAFGLGWWYAVVAILAALCLLAISTRPRIFERLLSLAMRIVRRPDVTLRLTSPVMRRATAWAVGGWICGGLHCWALVVALGGEARPSLAPSIAGFALALVAGTLFLPAPGGIGVREFVLAAALGGTIAGVDAGSGEVLAIVLLSRVMLALLDFLMAGAVLVLGSAGAPRGRDR
jgi:glycosyltransferase 2 family protein